MPKVIQATDTNSKEIEITLPSGAKLCCGAGGPMSTNSWGGYVRIMSPEGEELVYFDQDEWRDDPELVMGAIFGAALKFGAV